MEFQKTYTLPYIEAEDTSAMLPSLLDQRRPQLRFGSCAAHVFRLPGASSQS